MSKSNRDYTAFPSESNATPGLTKLEYIAIEMTKALIINDNYSIDHDARVEHYTELAVRFANALLNTLEAEKGK